MNVALLNWRDPKHPLAGGAEISLYYHAQFWISKGMQVTWFASRFPGAKEKEVIDGITVVRKGTHYTFFLHFLVFYLSGKVKNIDLIIDCFHFIPFFTPLYVRKRPVIALINEVAAEVWFENLPALPAHIGYRLEPYFLKLYKGKEFIVGSDSAKKDLVKNGIISKKIHVINHGFTPYVAKRARKKSKLPSMVFLARISKDKGIEDALAVVSLLKKDFKDIQLNIIGKAESEAYLEHVKELVKEKGLEDNCIFCGFVSEEVKYNIIASSWILLHPSKKEGWGLNVIEANSVGTPAVGYRVAGLIDSIIDNKTGLLSDVTTQSLYKTVKRLFNNKKQYASLSNNAVEWSKNFSWKKAGEKSYNLLLTEYAKQKTNN